MSRSLFDRPRMLIKRVLSPQKNKAPSQQAARTLLMLETLEDRNLLSATWVQPGVPSLRIEATRYAVDQVTHYISNYASTGSTVRQMVENLEQQAILAVSRFDSMVQQMVQQPIQKALFPSAGASSLNVQPGSTVAE